MAEIGEFIKTRDSVVMYNLDGKGFIYGVLSQLNPEKWGEKKLKRKKMIQCIIVIIKNYKRMQMI
jgi:hypothetical protein